MKLNGFLSLLISLERNAIFRYSLHIGALTIMKNKKKKKNRNKTPLSSAYRVALVITKCARLVHHALTRWPRCDFDTVRLLFNRWSQNSRPFISKFCVKKNRGGEKPFINRWPMLLNRFEEIERGRNKKKRFYFFSCPLVSCVYFASVHPHF